MMAKSVESSAAMFGPIYLMCRTDCFYSCSSSTSSLSDQSCNCTSRRAFLSLLLLVFTMCHFFPVVTASVAALDKMRYFNDHSIKPQRPPIASWRCGHHHRHCQSNCIPAVSGWNMLHHVPLVKTSQRHSHIYNTGSSHIATQLVSSPNKRRINDNAATNLSKVSPPDAYSYDDLTLFGRIIAATVEIAFTVATEYATGFVGGYILGSVTDIPRLLSPSRIAASKGLWQEFGSRISRTHGKSLGWARNWASISASFGGFRVSVRVLRAGKEDEWNTVLSSMVAGAFFARKGMCVYVCVCVL